MSGNADKNSDVFELTGGKAKLSYDVKGTQPIVFAVYVLPEGHVLEEEGGFAEVVVDNPGTDETFLVKKPGRYYISVKSANCSWKIKIEEER